MSELCRTCGAYWACEHRFVVGVGTSKSESIVMPTDFIGAAAREGDCWSDGGSLFIKIKSGDIPGHIVHCNLEGTILEDLGPDTPELRRRLGFP